MRTQLERIASLEDGHDSTEAALKQINEKLDKMHTELTRYKGFLGGVTFVGSCVMAFLALGKEWILSRIR